MPLATPTEVKDHLDITGAGDDAVITRFINDATAMLSRIRDFEASGSETRNFDAVRDVRGLDLMVDRVEAGNITAVVNGDGQTVSASNYVVVRERRIRLKRASGLVWRWDAKDDPTDAIAVTANWGPSTVDARVKEFVIAYAVWRYRNREAGDVSSVFVTDAGGGAVSTPVGWPEELKLKFQSLISPELG